ncbi:TQXA domain-containing protein/LPXTG-motif cell wall-anchored protein [Nocardiopsis mwathae]|uniref:TQXA domain-containing protein/LPXTG-motif cell wall-anchored protein n=1 Tax=Nocardiopsis mwathae TaxID=1472723 RepID=A0A7W9YE30_9ACTN|nr:Cys-Gln thioester bond-forming surface protein [Nocardiopsis mwathae]MBB6170412.1 TQXA domain-containing protein/LPXTG-motif cell wall-anchored protein [Nocardiopsis mwathae]
MIDTITPHSPHRRGRALTTVAATATAALLAFGVAASPALANAARGTYVGNAVNGPNLYFEGSHQSIRPSLFNLKLDGGETLQTYCIDYETQIIGGAKYEEDDWANYPGKGDFADPAKVHWILQNSFPTVDVQAVAEKSGVAGLTQAQAVAGTQAAIWHFSNDTKLDKNNRRNDAKAIALYEYLVENAAAIEQPQPSLTITPKSAEGKAGETIGEFKLETSAESVALDLTAPEGVELVDLETGKKVDSVGNGGSFGVKVPEDADPGEAKVSASTTTEMKAGRLFKGIEGQKATQTLITAKSSKISVSDEVDVKWAKADQPKPSPEPSEEPDEKPSPTPDKPTEPGDKESPAPKPEDKETPAPKPDDSKPSLPVTGAALAGLVAAGVAALGAGGGAMYLSRKRRSAADESAE